MSDPYAAEGAENREQAPQAAVVTKAAPFPAPVAAPPIPAPPLPATPYPAPPAADAPTAVSYPNAAPWPEQQPPVEKQPRRRLSAPAIGLIAGAGFVLLLIGGFAMTQTMASQAFDDTASALLEHATAARQAEAKSLAEGGQVGIQIQRASQLIEAAPAGSVDSSALTSLGAASQKASSTLATSAEDARAKISSDVVKPFWLWDLLAQRGKLEERISSLDALAARVDASRRDTLDAGKAMDAKAAALFASVEASAKNIENANISAKTGTIVALRKAAADASVNTGVSGRSLQKFTAYVNAVAAAKTSEKAELREKAGPLYKKRLAAEAFARSLSGGVLLDFDWKPRVLGYGRPGTMAGVTSWSSGDGGTATILLSNSVADEFPSAMSRALIAHEVGHAISAKCSDMFNWKSRDANEKWATAWAIGHGFDPEAGGVQAYGWPPQSLIKKSKGCR